MTVPVYMGKKQVDGIPDAYGVEVCVFGGKPEKYDVYHHTIVDKVYDIFDQEYDEKDEEGNVVKKIRKVKKCIGVHPAPFWEFNFQENEEIICVPVGSATVKFDIRWYELCEKRKEAK